MARRKSLFPAYLRHKPSGQARVRIDGKDHYLGPYGSEDSRRKYGAVLAAHSGGKPIDPVAPSPADDDAGPSVAEIVLTFLRWAEGHYVSDGRNTSELHCLKMAVSPLVDLFGVTPAAEFGPLSLKAVRAKMIDLRWCRSVINQSLSRLRRVFRHAVENELIPGETLNRLKAVKPLLHGRTKAREAEPVAPVADAVVDATLPHCPEIVRDMVRVQRLTGMRPQEVCRIRWDEIDDSGECWLYRPRKHKLSHHGLPRVIAIGPQAQTVLLARRGLDIAGPVFPGKGGPFTVAAYRRAITRGCEVAFDMPKEFRNQLRHTFATRSPRWYAGRPVSTRRWCCSDTPS